MGRPLRADPRGRSGRPGRPRAGPADLSVWDDSWTALFDEADTVVHLAGSSDPAATWDAMTGPNVDAMTNVLLASAQAGVDRVVFASVRRAPGSTEPAGASKLVGERLGRGFAAAFGLTFVAVRLGSAPPASGDEIVRLFTDAIEAELDEGAFAIVPG